MMTPNGGEPMTHDDGDLWADRAPRGWIRCAGCGAEWAVEDESECECEEDEE